MLLFARPIGVLMTNVIVMNNVDYIASECVGNRVALQILTPF